MANNGVDWTSAPVALPNGFEKHIDSILGQLFQVYKEYLGHICEDSQIDLASVIHCLCGVKTRCHSTGEYNPLVDVQPESHDQHENYLRQQVEEIDEIMQEGLSILPDSPLAHDVESSPKSDHMSQSNDINCKPYPESDHTQSSDLGHSPGSDHTQNSDFGSPAGDQGPTTPQLPSDKAGYYCTHPGCKFQKPFKYLSKLKDHIRKHQPASVQCPKCKGMFKQERILKKHLLRIHKSTEKNQKAVKNTASSQMQPQFHQSPSPDTSYSAVTFMGWDQNNTGLGEIISLLEGSSFIDHHWADVPTSYNSCGLFDQE